jgi:ribonucleoside-diphosphate reductase alpha chain
MMAAAQPFLSGAISKTVNMPRESTVDDIREAYLEGWRLGLKAIAIYRDGSKESQPVSTSSDADKSARESAEVAALTASLQAEVEELRARLAATPAIPAPRPKRERLPDTRHSVTHKFDIQGHEGYLTVGFFDDGRPGELFITMAKEGSTVGGLMDVIGTLVSMGLQYGVPLDVYVNKFAHSRFEPSGFTKNPDIPIAKSITDYIFRWMGIQYVPGYRAANTPHRETEATLVEPVPSTPTIKVNGHRKATAADLDHAEGLLHPEPDHHHHPATEASVASQQEQFASFQSDAPACDNCGSLTVRCGTCYRCFNCGNSMGCS